MTTTFTDVGTYVVRTCGHCGIAFAMESEFDAKLQTTHATFFCPNGHQRHYVGETEAERLRRTLRAVEARELRMTEERNRARVERDHAQRSARVTKGKAAALRRRIKAGVCPCCHRTFKQLGAHMTAKHPHFANTPEVAL